MTRPLWSYCIQGSNDLPTQFFQNVALRTNTGAPEYIRNHSPAQLSTNKKR